MDDTTTTSSDSDTKVPRITIELKQDYATDMMAEEVSINAYEVQNLLHQALRGTLDGVSAETIETEIRHRSEKREP